MGKLDKLYVKFGGAGNPKSKYWFFSIEPGGKCDEVKENYSKDDLNEILQWLQRIDEKADTFYKRLNLLIQKLTCENIIYEADGEKRVKMDSKTCCCFKSDIFMLNFEKTTESKYKEGIECYKGLFDEFSSEKFGERSGYEKYLKEVMHIRYERNFKKYLNGSQKKFVFLFSRKKEYFEYLEKLLGIENEAISEEDTFEVWYRTDNKGRKVYSNVNLYNYSNFILVRTPHLSRWPRFNDEVKRITNKIKSFYDKTLQTKK